MYIYYRRVQRHRHLLRRGFRQQGATLILCARGKSRLQQVVEAIADKHGTAIRVSEVDPGMVNTNYALTRFKGDAQRAETVYAGTTLLSADGIVQAVCFCASRPPHGNIAEMLVLPTDQKVLSQININS